MELSTQQMKPSCGRECVCVCVYVTFRYAEPDSRSDGNFRFLSRIESVNKVNDRNQKPEAQVSNLTHVFWPYAAGGEERFEVDRRSGEIRTTAQPLTPSKEYLLQVQAMDLQGHKGPRATVAILAGYRPPQFTNATYNLDIPEDTGVGQPWVRRLDITEMVSLIRFLLHLLVCVSAAELEVLQFCSMLAGRRSPEQLREQKPAWSHETFRRLPSS